MRASWIEPSLPLPPLAAGEVHLWRLRWTGLDSLAPLESLLSPDEKTRAARFVRFGDRARSVAGRGLLRAVLAGSLSRSPSGLAFSPDAYGKPRLDEPVGSDRAAIEPVAFNVAHSGAWVLVAVGRVAALGVDVERERADVDVMELADVCFARREVEALVRQPPSRLRAAFFAGWARKEAVVKALGVGLSADLKSFAVSLDASCRMVEPPRSSGGEACAPWTLAACAPGAGYAGAIAVRGAVGAFRCFEADGLVEALRVASEAEKMPGPSMQPSRRGMNTGESIAPSG